MQKASFYLDTVKVGRITLTLKKKIKKKQSAILKLIAEQGKRNLDPKKKKNQIARP